MPVQPRLADKRKNIFNIKVDVSSFPELAVYKGLAFEVNESREKFDERLYDIKWDKANLNSSAVAGNYDLTLLIRDSVVNLLVYPVFSNRNYGEALKVYQEKKQDWLANQQKKKNTGNQPENASGITTDETTFIETTQTCIDYASLKAIGKRHFSISRLGIYQSAMPYHATDMQVLQPKLTDLAGHELRELHLFIADREHNILYNFGKSQAIAYDKSANNLFWFVTPDGKMGIVSPESFAALASTQNKPLIKVQLMEPQKGIGILKETMQI
jgi:hypothetical protein